MGEGRECVSVGDWGWGYDIVWGMGVEGRFKGDMYVLVRYIYCT